MRNFSPIVGLPLVGVLWIAAPDAAAGERDASILTSKVKRAPVSDTKRRLAPISVALKRPAAVGTTDTQLLLISREDWTPVPIEFDRLLTTVRIGVFASQVMDLGTTAYGMETGTVKEANPLMRWAADDPLALASVKLGTAVGLDWIIRELSKRGHRKTAIILGIALTTASVAVSIHNLNEIRDAQR